LQQEEAEKLIATCNMQHARDETDLTYPPIYRLQPGTRSNVGIFMFS